MAKTTALNLRVSPALKRILGMMAATEAVSLSRLVEMQLCLAAQNLVVMSGDDAAEYWQQARAAMRDFEETQVRMEISDELKERLELAMASLAEQAEQDSVSTSDLVDEMRYCKPGFESVENWLTNNGENLWPLATIVRAELIREGESE